MKRLLKKILKEVLNFRSEYFITVIAITLLILSIKYIGFNNIWNIGFNICLLLMIPCTFFGIRISRNILYEVWIGKRKNENK